MVLQSSSVPAGSLLVWKKEKVLRTDVPFNMIFSKLG